MSTGKFCNKCRRFTNARNWCDRHGKHVTGWTDMCEEEKAERAERLNNAC